MNSALNVMSANQTESNELRELSHEEKIVVSGGLACYRNPVGFNNPDRYLSQGGGAIRQTWNGRAYVNGIFLSNVGNFRNWCRARGYRTFA